MKIIILKLLLIVIVCHVQIISSKNGSDNIIIDLILKYIKDNNLEDTAEFSGKGLNDLGKYDSCLDKNLEEKNRYMTINLFLSDNIQLYAAVGACVKSNVSPEKLQYDIRQLIIENKLDQLLKINVNNVKVFEPVPLANNGWQFNFVVTIYSILAIVTLLAFYNTFLEIDKKQQGILFKITSCFNPIINFKQAITIVERSDEYSLEFFEGIRALSTMSVVFAHQYYIRGYQPINKKQQDDFFSTFGAVMLQTLQFSVDIFFYLSGFFIAFANLSRKTQYIQTIFQRYFRIVILYFFMIMFYWQLLPRLGSGPQMNILYAYTGKCKNLWRNLLLIDNLFNTDDYCFGWGWYLSNDFQMFLISLFLIWIYKSGKVILAKLLIIALIIAQIIASFVIYAQKKIGLLLYMGITGDTYDLFNTLYDKPYHRWSVYFIGLITGIYFIEMKMFNRKYKISLSEHKVIDRKQPILLNVSVAIRRHYALKLLCYLFGLFLICFFSFFIYDYQTSNRSWGMPAQYYFNVMARPSFVVGIIICFLPCLLQYSNYVKCVFGCYFFKFISKFSFSIYLIHYQVIQLNFFTSRQNLYFSANNFFNNFLSDFIITLFFSVIASTLIEQPFQKIDGILFQRPSAALVQSTKLGETINLSVSNKSDDVTISQLNAKLLENQSNKL